MSEGRDHREELKQALAAHDALAPDDRPGWLAHLAERDPALAAAVKAWVEAPTYRDPDGRGLSVVVDAAAALPPPAPHATPREVGPYRLLEVLGSGGMGVVYRAVQEHPLEREVALKLLRGVLDAERVVARFDAERRALSRADHPGIARILDAGTGVDGTPYLAMELVRGLPITRFAAERNLARRALLELFVQVCRAVQHAHQKGIIHRDLKPSNILVAEVDGKAQVKVIDFGIARILDESAPAATLLTHEGQVVGTLGYMSPEQALGRAREIDTRSDVYSLGAVLYELLTGELPHDLRGRSLTEAVRALDQEPPRRFRDTTRGTGGADELETICMKALAREAERRYDGPGALADDLERHLRDEPIVARPPSAAYQLRKLVARHRAAVAVAVGGLVLLAGFAAAMSVLYSQARREEAKAAAINRFMRRVMTSADPEQLGREVTVRDMLDLSLPTLRRDLASEQEVMASVLVTLGATYRALGAQARADSLLREGLAIQRRVASRDDPEMAFALREIASIPLNYGTMEQVAAAEPLAREALAIQRRRFGPRSPEVAATLQVLGKIAQDRFRYARAESLLGESVSILREARSDPADLGRTLNALADLHTTRGYPDKALPLASEAVRVLESGVGEMNPRTIEAINGLALPLRLDGRLEEAARWDSTAVARARRALGPDHPLLPNYINNLASTLRDLSRFAEAERLEREALALWIRRHGSRNVLVGIGYRNMGLLRHARRDYAGAREWHLRAIRLLGELNHVPLLCQSRHWYGMALAEEGRVEAGAILRQAVADHRAAIGSQPPVAVNMMGLGCWLADQGLVDSAAAVLEEGLGILSSGARLVEISFARANLGMCRAAQGRTAEAESLLASSVEQVLQGGPFQYRRPTLRRLARFYRENGPPELAARCERALAVCLAQAAAP